MESWKVCGPAIAGCHHIDDEQDPDPQVKSRILIRSKVTRIRNPDGARTTCSEIFRVPKKEKKQRLPYLEVA